jgi:serine/threonine protein kinase HipA of HipAB toxin-antitoxin module
MFPGDFGGAIDEDDSLRDDGRDDNFDRTCDCFELIFEEVFNFGVDSVTG